MSTTTESKSIQHLENLTDASVFIDHHKQVAEWHRRGKQEIVTAMSMVAGDQFTDEQVQKLTHENKMPIVLDFIRPAYRTIKGILDGNQFDVTFEPREKRDQQVADILKNFYSYTAYQGKFQETDSDQYMNAYVGGVGYTETIIEFHEGHRPQISVIP